MTITINPIVDSTNTFPGISGTTTTVPDTITVTIVVDGTTYTATESVTVMGGAWEFDIGDFFDGMGTALAPGDLTEGTLTFNVSNTAGDTAMDSFDFDETAPNMPTAFMIAAGFDSGTAGDNTTLEAMPIIEFMAEPGSTVEVFDSLGVMVGTAVEASPGQFTITVSLNEGSNDFTAVATDAADNSSPAANFSVTLDTMAPDISSIALDMASDSGVAMDSITNAVSYTHLTLPTKA